MGVTLLLLQNLDSRRVWVGTVGTLYPQDRLVSCYRIPANTMILGHFEFWAILKSVFTWGVLGLYM